MYGQHISSHTISPPTPGSCGLLLTINVVADLVSEHRANSMVLRNLDSHLPVAKYVLTQDLILDLS